MSELYDTYKDDGLVVIGATKYSTRVATYNKESFKDLDYETERDLMQQLAKDFGLTFPVAMNREGINFQNYKVKFIPTLVLVDRHGIIRKVGHPYGKPLEDLVTRLLAEKY